MPPTRARRLGVASHATDAADGAATLDTAFVAAGATAAAGVLVWAAVFNSVRSLAGARPGGEPLSARGLSLSLSAVCLFVGVPLGVLLPLAASL